MTSDNKHKFKFLDHSLEKYINIPNSFSESARNWNDVDTGTVQIGILTSKIIVKYDMGQYLLEFRICNTNLSL